MTPAKFAASATALLSLLATASAQDTGYACNGVVVRFGTHQPLNHALVRIASTNEATQQAMFVTSGDGRFAFGGLHAGKYRLSVQKEGYSEQFYRSGQPGLSTAIVLGPGLNAENILFEMHAPGSISGTAVDENGDPVQGHVVLFERGIFGGRTSVRLVRDTSMESAGKFLFERLRPSTYLVGVSGHPWFAVTESMMDANGNMRPPPRGERDVSFPVTYYDQTTDPVRATPIQLQEGQEVTIRLTPHLERTVRAVLDFSALAVPSEPHAAPPMVNLSVVGPAGIPVSVQNQFAMFRGDQRVTHAMVPGQYRIEVQRFAKGQRQELGSRVVDIRDDTTLDISSLPKMQVSGRLTVEPATQGQPLTIQLVAIAQKMNFFQTRVQPDGSFVFDDAPPAGPYELHLRSRQGLQLKSVDATGARFENGELDIPDTSNVRLAVTATTAVTKVQGIALHEKQSYAGALVLLIAEDPKAANGVYFDQSDSDGSFEIANVIPGRYRLIAIDDGESLAYLEPKVLQPYLTRASSLEVRAQGVPSLRVPVQTRIK